MKKVLIGIVSVILCVALLAGGILVMGYNYGANYDNSDVPEQVDVKELNENSVKWGTVSALGRALYDAEGKRFDIQGINFGNLFIAEGWMTVNSIGPKLDENGELILNNEKNVVMEYLEIYQEEMDEILSKNFTDEEIKALNDAYFYSYCTEADFQVISDMGLNTIRLPVYYRNFMEGSDENLTMRKDAFEKLDWFLENAKKYNLKVIIDMHGVVGGQSGYEHSGTKDIDFWTNPTYIESMCELWKNIALHYKDDRADLASTILAYDLVNEPTNRNEIGTGPLQWQIMDLMYKAIRSVDDYHVISIEGVWYPVSLPDPAKYGWENVIYQYHFYNWNTEKGISNEMFYGLQFALYKLSDYDVPKFVGEFTFFDDEAAWSKYLDMYENLGWGWTIWSYKIVSVGWWDNSWGVVVNRMNLIYPEMKLDITTATYDEIMEVWSNQRTQYGDQEGPYQIYNDGVLYKVIKEHLAKED